MKKCIYLPPLQRFREIAPYNRQRMVIANIGLSRRKLLEEISITFARQNVEIYCHTGMRYYLREIDVIFGNDPDMRWLSNYLASDKDGMPRYMSDKLDRLVYLYVFAEVRLPDAANHIFR